MDLKKSLGIIFIFLSIIISVSNLNLTGAIIGSSLSNSFSFIAAAFLVVGVLLIMAGRKDYNSRELMKIARKSGYEIKTGYKEGTRVYNDGKVLSVIPNHRKISLGVQKKVLEALLTGISSFRKSPS